MQFAFHRPMCVAFLLKTICKSVEHPYNNFSEIYFLVFNIVYVFSQVIAKLLNDFLEKNILPCSTTIRYRYYNMKFNELETM